jgi:hypothetical protein
MVAFYEVHTSHRTSQPKPADAEFRKDQAKEAVAEFERRVAEGDYGGMTSLIAKVPTKHQWSSVLNHRPDRGYTYPFDGARDEPLSQEQRRALEQAGLLKI